MSQACCASNVVHSGYFHTVGNSRLIAQTLVVEKKIATFDRVNSPFLTSVFQTKNLSIIRDYINLFFCLSSMLINIIYSHSDTSIPNISLHLSGLLASVPSTNGNGNGGMMAYSPGEQQPGTNSSTNNNTPHSKCTDSVFTPLPVRPPI